MPQSGISATIHRLKRTHITIVSLSANFYLLWRESEYCSDLFAFYEVPETFTFSSRA